MTKFRICIAGRNHEAFTTRCLQSVIAQRGNFEPNFAIDWTDDRSETEEAYAIAVDQSIALDPVRIRVARTTHRRGGLENLWRAICRAKEGDVCVLLGGDDWLEPGALDRIAREYEDPECWATYGQLKNTLGPEYFCAHEWVKDTDPRDQQFVWAPLTVRAKLAKKVLEADLQMNGWFFPASGDVALNIPIVEMAGHDRTRWIPDAWYSRRIHAGNDHNADKRLQDFCSFQALAKPKYERLASMDEEPIRTNHVLRSSILFPARDACGHFVAF